jgi:ketosteroid isomerase-like protein
MYKTIVRAKVRGTFAALTNGDTGPFFASLGNQFTYRFVGDSSLSGHRSTREAMQSWWTRVFTLVPGGRFEVNDITVNGAPWNTTVMTHVVVTAKLKNGEDYSNEFMQLLRLRFGKVIEIRTLEDTKHLADMLHRLAEVEPLALAAPITDAVPVR